MERGNTPNETGAGSRSAEPSDAIGATDRAEPTPDAKQRAIEHSVEEYYQQEGTLEDSQPPEAPGVAGTAGGQLPPGTD